MQNYQKMAGVQFVTDTIRFTKRKRC